MKILVKTTLEPLYGKIPARWRKRLPVIEGYQTRLIAKYEIVEPKDGQPALSVKPYIAYGYAAAFRQTVADTLEWREADTVSMRFYPRGSGHSEVRVYFRGLDASDKIIDEMGKVHAYEGAVENGQKFPYYCRVCKIYSLLEVVTVVLAVSVLAFTILLSIVTIVLVIRPSC